MISPHESRPELRFTTNLRVAPSWACMQNTRHDSTCVKLENEKIANSASHGVA